MHQKTLSEILLLNILEDLVYQIDIPQDNRTFIFWFILRERFVLMCERIMNDPEVFKAHFMDYLLPLANDRVTNVRITLAKILQNVYKEKSKNVDFFFKIF